MDADTEYRGQEYRDGQDPTGVPPQPPGAEARTSDGPPRQGIAVFAKVIMTGNYGLLCAQQQVLTFHNITLAQARKRKWDYFGNCSCVMTCYDAHGNVVLEE